MSKVLSLILLGEPASKKNSSEIATINIKGKDGKPITRRIVVPSKMYKKYEKEYGAQIPKEAKMKIDYPVCVKAVYYRSTKRIIDKSNLENALLDMLVAKGVLEDDCRDIVASTDGSRVYYDKYKPRTEVCIMTLDEEYEIWKKK